MELSEHLAWTKRAIAELKWHSPHFTGELGEGLFDRTLKPNDPPQRRNTQADRETALAVLAEHGPAVVRAMVQHGIDAAPLDRVTDGSPDPLSHEYAATLQAAAAPLRLLEAVIAGEGKQKKQADPYEWKVRAMSLVRDNPEWSDAKIAREVEKSPSTVSKSTEYQTAAKMARGEGTPHRGHVETGDHRDVEAYAEGTNPANMDWD